MPVPTSTGGGNWTVVGSSPSIRRVAGSSCRSQMGSDGHALLPDHCPAYISWDQYARNVARLAANRARAAS